MHILRTNSDHQNFKNFVAQLDAYLAKRNGEQNDFFAQFNTVENLNHVIIIFEDETAVGCGAMKEFDDQIMEVKRMYVPIERR